MMILIGMRVIVLFMFAVLLMSISSLILTYRDKIDQDIKITREWDARINADSKITIKNFRRKN